MQFMIPRIAMIAGTKSYETMGAGTKTVLIMECDEDKVLREIELIERRDEEAGWRTWTVTTVVKRKAAKTAPNIVGPKHTKTPRESKQTSKLVAKLVEAKGGKVSLLNRAGQPVTVTLKQLSVGDREYIRDWSSGAQKDPASEPAAQDAVPTENQASTPLVRDEVAATSVTGAADENTPNDGAPAAGKDDSRVRWLNETYHTIVRYVANKKVWEEVDDKTGKVNWVNRETARTDEFVELLSPERKAEIRLRADKMEQKLNGQWQWVANGRWDTPREQGANMVGKGDKRTRWINESYHTTVSRAGDKKWADVHDQTGDVWNTYVEKARTDDYIEVYCARTKDTIRYFSSS